MTDPVSAASSEQRTGGGDGLRALFGRHAATPALTLETMTAQAFRAIVAERLRALERDLAEVRSRVNGLLFVVAGAVVTQVVLRLVG